MTTQPCILTRMTPVWSLASPRELLFCGKRVFTNADKVRTFNIQKVRYEDGQPLHKTGLSLTDDYTSLVELFKENPSYRNTTILDYDNHYQIYKP